MKRIVRTIGTGSAIATTKRAHSATLVRVDDSNSLLVDAGDGTARALIAGGEKIETISAVAISHFHPDHAGGLPALIQQFRFAAPTVVRPLFLPSLAATRLPAMLQGFGITETKFRAVFEPIILPPDPGVIQLAGSLHLETFRNSHQGADSPLGESHSFVLRHEAHGLYLSADVGSIDDVIAHGAGCDTAIVETTHVHPDKIIAVASDIGFRTLVLSHVPPEWEDRAQRNKEQADIDIRWATDGDVFAW